MADNTHITTKKKKSSEGIYYNRLRQRLHTINTHVYAYREKKFRYYETDSSEYWHHYVLSYSFQLHK